MNQDKIRNIIDAYDECEEEDTVSKQLSIPLEEVQLVYKVLEMARLDGWKPCEYRQLKEDELINLGKYWR